MRRREPKSIDAVLNDPGASYALKAVLLVWRARDPVDAANDARLLARLLAARAERMLRSRDGQRRP